MNASPLNYSDVGYDFACNARHRAPCCTQVHADGEIWSATNFAIREAMNARYDGTYPSSDAALQRSCADGLDARRRSARATGAGSSSCSTPGS